MRCFRAHQNRRAHRATSLALFVSLTIAAAACGANDGTHNSPCTAPIAGVCTTNVDTSAVAKRPTGGGPPVAAPVAIPSFPDAGVAMPQFEYEADGSIRVKP